MAEEVKVVESKEQVALLGQIATDLKMQNRLLEKVNAGQAEEIQKEDMYAKMFDEAEKNEQARHSESTQDARASARERIKSSIETVKNNKQLQAGLKGLNVGFSGLSKTIGFLTKPLSAIASPVKKIGGGALTILKSLGVVAGFAAVLAFLNSPYFQQLKSYLSDEIIPALVDFFNNKIKPAFDAFIKFAIPIIKDVFGFFIDEVVPVLTRVGDFLFNDVLPILGVAFVNSIEILKNLFGDIVGAFDKILSGDFLGGITDLIMGIGTAVVNALDVAATGIFNIIASLFGLEQTDSVFGSISKFFTDIYNSVVSFFSEGFTSLTTFLSGIITQVVDYLKKLFSFDPDSFGSSFAGLFDIAFAGVNIAVNLIKDIFSIGDPDIPFKLSEFIGSIFQKLGEIFKSLFSFDVKSLAKEFLPDAAVDYLFGDGQTDAEKNAERVKEIDAEIEAEQVKQQRAMQDKRFARRAFGLQGATMGIKGSQTKVARLQAEREKLVGPEAEEMGGLAPGEVATGINTRANALRELEAERRATAAEDSTFGDGGRTVAAGDFVPPQREKFVIELGDAFASGEFRERGAVVQRQGPPGQSGAPTVSQVNLQNIDNSDNSSSSTVTSSPIVDQNPMVRAALGAY